MPPAALSLAFFVIEEAIKEAPAIAAGLQQLFAKANPTREDWDALRSKVAAKSYQDYVPDSALPRPA